MFAIHSQVAYGRSSFKFILLTSAHLLAVALIIHQICQFHGGATAQSNRKKETRQLEVDKIIDRRTLASGTSASNLHPYGDSFEAIDSRSKSDLTMTPVDPMKTAASK